MSDPSEFVTVHFSKLRSLDKSNRRLWERLTELERVVSNITGLPPEPEPHERRRAGKESAIA